MFDRELHKEYLFCSYLVQILPADPVEVFDLEGKLKLEYYKLQKTFEGEISLDEAKGVYEQAGKKGAAGKDPKEPLDEIIEKINERFKGNFTDADRVVLTILQNELMKDNKLRKRASSSDPQIFVESIFPSFFESVAMESYIKSQETFASMFEDKAKYQAICSALAEVVYREMRRKTQNKCAI